MITKFLNVDVGDVGDEEEQYGLIYLRRILLK